MADAPGPFTGFADDERRFFRALAKHQDRDWFAAHKAEYEEGWAKPMASLLTAVRKKLDAAYPDVEVAEPKLFRIYRDVRFAKDKAPYKTYVAGLVPVKAMGPVTEVPAPLYFQVGSDGCETAAGSWGMRPPVLARYRAAVLDEKKGKEIAKIVLKLEKEGFRVGSMETLKKVPQGVDPAHPRAELLRHKGLMVAFPDVPAKLLTSPELVTWLVTHAKKAAPLVRWLAFTTA